MRPIFLRAVAGASLSLSALMVSPADSVPIAIPTAMKSASDAQSLTQVVHCRKYRHWHASEHRWSRGCGVDAAGRRTPSGVARAGVGRSGSPGVRSITGLPRVSAPSGVARQPANFLTPSNPQDRSGSSNRQDMTQPRSMNPQDMR